MISQQFSIAAADRRIGSGVSTFLLIWTILCAHEAWCVEIVEHVDRQNRSADYQNLTLEGDPSGRMIARIQFEGENLSLILEPYSMRAEDFELWVQGEDGSLTKQSPLAPRTLRGYVAERPGSRVAASLVDGRLSAAAGFTDGTHLFIEPNDADQADPASHVVYVPGVDEKDSRACGVDGHLSEPGSLPPEPEAGYPFLVSTQIAIDTDYELFLLAGSTAEGAVSMVEESLNIAEHVYHRDAGIVYEITALIVRATASDPYSPTTGQELLDAFRSYWNNNMTHIARDTAHMITGKEMDVAGIAFLGVICNLSQAYGLSSFHTPDTANRATIVAHELGHNWSASHCDGLPGCATMCSIIGECTGSPLHFSPSSRSWILAHRDTRVCLDLESAPPHPCGPGDVDNNGDVDLADHALFIECSTGPGQDTSQACTRADMDQDGDVDLGDWRLFQIAFGTTCPLGPDLRVATVFAPDDAGIGASITAQFVIQNVGDVPVGTHPLLPIYVSAYLSLDGVLGNGNDLFLGETPVALLPDLQPGGTLAGEINDLHIPPQASPGEQWLFVCADTGTPPCGGICESDENNNCRSTIIDIRAADAWVESVVAPAGLIGIPVSGEYDVLVCRDAIGPDDLLAPFTVTIGNPTLTFHHDVVWLERAECANVSVFVPTPEVPWGCDVTTVLPVLACTHLDLDDDPSNDCASTGVAITAPYYDLVYEVDGPAAGCLFEPVNWTVTVTNVGNVPSLPTASRTGLCAGAGGDYTTCVGGGPILFAAPQLEPDWSATLSFALTPQPGVFLHQYLKAGVDPFGGGVDLCPMGNQDDEPITINQPNVAVSYITVPDDVIGGIGWRTYGVTVANTGPCDADNVPVQLCLAGNCATCNVDVPASSAASCTVTLLTPASFGGCGQVNDFTVTGCSLFPDPTPSNDCINVNVPIEVPYWDLRLEPVNAPNSANRGSFITWGIKITNVGNIPSMNVCMISGINCAEGSGNWGCNLGINNFTTPYIPANGGTWTHSVGNYYIPWNAFPGWQYIKAEVHYSAGCFDNCSAGNYVEHSIFINP